MVGYFAVLHAHDIDGLEVNFAMSWNDAKEKSFMRPVVGLVSSHTISVGKLPVDFGVKVGEGLTYVLIEPPHSCLVGGHSSSRLRRVVNKVVREQFFENLKVALSLDFFGISTDNSLRGIA